MWFSPSEGTKMLLQAIVTFEHRWVSAADNKNKHAGCRFSSLNLERWLLYPRSQLLQQVWRSCNSSTHVCFHLIRAEILSFEACSSIFLRPVVVVMWFSVRCQTASGSMVTLSFIVLVSKTISQQVRLQIHWGCNNCTGCTDIVVHCLCSYCCRRYGNQTQKVSVCI